MRWLELTESRSAPLCLSSQPATMNRRDALAEEFVIGDIKALHRYVTAVEMPRMAYALSNWKMEDMRDAAQNYCQQWRIPFSMHPSVAQRYEEIDQDRQYDDED